MDYEKKYKEALERAKLYHRNELAGTRQEMTEYIFPELRESEDERIRQALLTKFIGEKNQGAKYTIHGCSLDSIITYLEKQKEQKPDIEHIQQSWYMEGYKDHEHNREPKWIVKIGEGGPKYELNPKYGQDLIKEQKLWTFNEPYDPDECEVVMEGNAISLKRKEQKSVDYDHEMWKNCEANFEGGKKEVIEHPEKYGLQKPTEWSEDDERIYQHCLVILHDYGYDEWLKSFRSRPVQGWSEEDEKCMNLILRVLNVQQSWDGAAGKTFNPYQNEIDWLKSLRSSWKSSEVEYVRKDLLLKWAKIELERRRNTGDDYFYPAIVVLGNLIDKLDSL